ncbi:MAG: HNH endonuclease [Pyrinomonadaceae bacterium]
MLDSYRLAEILTARFRLALTPEVRRVSDAGFACVRAADVPAPNGFVVQVTSGWRSVDAEFAPDKFAGDLIRGMGTADAAARRAFANAAAAFSSTGARVSLRINLTAVTDFAVLPAAPWSSFELKVHRMSIAGTEGPDALQLEAADVAAICLALVLSLLPVEEEDAVAPVLFELGLPEGAKTFVEVNRYERSPVNRAACIAIHGSTCGACGLDFEKRYGSLGAGYIEVHHVVPVSKMNAGYVVDPAQDLVPLCANCHAMVHRRDPPVPLVELRSLLGRQ